MAHVLRGNIKMGLNMAGVILNGLIIQSMTASFMIIIFKEKVNNCYNFKGIYTWSDKRQFIGDWKNNKMHGEGTFIWPDDKKYKGQYFEDKKQGYGVFEWYLIYLK